ncbi:MAG: tetratricopeptide repeat protein [Bradymonadaceae bacterium]
MSTDVHNSPAVLALVMAGLVLGGCSGPETSRRDERALEAAELRDRGKLDAAEQTYRRLLESASSAEQRRRVRLQLARIAADRGRPTTALDRYEAIWSADRRDALGGRAMSEAADLLARRGDADRARELRRRLVVRFPKTNWSERAAEIIADAHREEARLDHLKRLFDRLHGDVRGEPVADNLLFLAAEALDETGRDGEAVDWYARLLREHPEGNMVDDAEWELANIYLDHRRWRLARTLLRRVADRVYVSRFIGSYNSPWAADARFALGWIHLVHLDDYRRARRHFRTYVRKFPHTVRTDDASWHLAQTFRLQGRSRRFRRKLRSFIEDYPQSRRVDLARELLERSKG